MLKKRIIILLLLLGLAVGGYTLWSQSHAEGAAAPVRLSGNVDIRSVNLSFRVGGRMAAAMVDEGARVQAGDELARLDAEPLEIALRQTEANVESARLAVSMAEKEAASLKATLDLRRAGYRKEQVEQARASLEAQRVLFANAEREYKRQQALVAKGAVSQSSYDAARREYESQRALVEVASAKRAEMEAGYRPEEIAQAEAQYEAALAAVETKRAQLSAAEVAREQVALNLSDTRLISPSAGIIMTRVLEPGSMVAAGSPVYVLSLREPVRVRAYIDEPLLDRVHLGQKVRVLTDGGKTYEGTIGFISPKAEFTPKTVETADIRTTLVYRLRIVLEGDEAAALNQGAPVVVEILGAVPTLQQE